MYTLFNRLTSLVYAKKILHLQVFKLVILTRRESYNEMGWGRSVEECFDENWVSCNGSL